MDPYGVTGVSVTDLVAPSATTSRRPRRRPCSPGSSTRCRRARYRRAPCATLGRGEATCSRGKLYRLVHRSSCARWPPTMGRTTSGSGRRSFRTCFTVLPSSYPNNTSHGERRAAHGVDRAAGRTSAAGGRALCCGRGRAFLDDAGAADEAQRVDLGHAAPERAAWRLPEVLQPVATPVQVVDGHFSRLETRTGCRPCPAKSRLVVRVQILDDVDAAGLSTGNHCRNAMHW